MSRRRRRRSPQDEAEAESAQESQRSAGDDENTGAKSGSSNLAGKSSGRSSGKEAGHAPDKSNQNGHADADDAAKLDEDEVSVDASAEESDGPERRRFVIRRNPRTRIDRYLQNRLKGISRTKVRQLIDLGGVTVNDKPVKASHVVKQGDFIDVILPPRAVRRIVPEPIPIHVIYEDAAVLVVNKQANLLVHPARNNLTGTLLHGLAWRFKEKQEAVGKTFTGHQTRGFDEGKPRAGARARRQAAKDERSKMADAAGGAQSTPGAAGDRLDGHEHDEPGADGAVDGLSEVGSDAFRPGIIHRLDRNTTGVMVLAKADDAHWHIARQFEHRQTIKAYLAIVHGNFDEPGGVIEAPLGTHPTIREAQAVRHDSAGKASVTIYRVREQYEGYSLVELELKTGRTHQIRVHLSYIGYPIVGDIVYGGEPVGHGALDDPPTPAAIRRMFTFARDKADGERVVQQAAASDDIIMATPALHAAYLSFVHPYSEERVTFQAPLHEPMASLLRELRKRPRAKAPTAKEGYWIATSRMLEGEGESDGDEERS